MHFVLMDFVAACFLKLSQVFDFHKTTSDLQIGLHVLEMSVHVLETGLHDQQIALLVPERPLNLETRKLICCFSLVLPNRNTNLLNRTLNLRNEA